MNVFRRIAHCGILVTAVGCSRKAEPSADAGSPAAASSPAVEAGTAVAVEQPFVVTVDAIGTVEPRAGHFAVLSAPLPARVAGVGISAGQGVTKGDTLITLEQGGFVSALRTAEATLASAESARNRLQRLVDQGISPRRDLDQAIADYARADAEVAGARRMMDLSIIRAPFSGVVTRMNATLGASVDPSQPLIEVADPSSVDLLLSVPAADASRIRSGNAVVVRSGLRASDDPVARGVVVDVAGIVDPAGRGVAVRVRATSTTRPLRIGETLSGAITIATRAHAVTVPSAALVPDGDGYKVFVVDSAAVAHVRAVTVGGKNGTTAEILDGVIGGERVVTTGAFGVDEGARITTRP